MKTSKDTFYFTVSLPDFQGVMFKWNTESNTVTWTRNRKECEVRCEHEVADRLLEEGHWIIEEDE